MKKKTLKFSNRFWKYKIIFTDSEITRIDKEDHRNYAGGTSYEKDGFKNSPLINQLEDMIRDEIDDKQAEEKIRYFLKKEIENIKPIYDKKILNTKSNLPCLQSHQ